MSEQPPGMEETKALMMGLMRECKHAFGMISSSYYINRHASRIVGLEDVFWEYKKETDPVVEEMLDTVCSIGDPDEVCTEAVRDLVMTLHNVTEKYGPAFEVDSLVHHMFTYECPSNICFGMLTLDRILRCTEAFIAQLDAVQKEAAINARPAVRDAIRTGCMNNIRAACDEPFDKRLLAGIRKGIRHWPLLRKEGMTKIDAYAATLEMYGIDLEQAAKAE